MRKTQQNQSITTSVHSTFGRGNRVIPADPGDRLFGAFCCNPDKERTMKTKAFAYPALLASILLCGLTFAQEPVQDIDPRVHPNLAEAQKHVIEANRSIAGAQKDNRYDMKGHAEKARQLLVEVNNELKAAAEAANASMRKK
jgi:hypothetical protein